MADLTEHDRWLVDRARHLAPELAVSAVIRDKLAAELLRGLVEIIERD